MNVQKLLQFKGNCALIVKSHVILVLIMQQHALIVLQVFFFLYKNTYITDCPLGTFEEGLFCSPCDDDCINCTDSSDFCHECQNDYYLFNNHCYSSCTVLNNEINNEFYGKDDETKMCKKCDDQNCIDCSENYLICKECGYII